MNNPERKSGVSLWIMLAIVLLGLRGMADVWGGLTGSVEPFVVAVGMSEMAIALIAMYFPHNH